MNYEEAIFLLIVAGLSAAMLLGSYSYGTVVATMPRTLAVLTLVFALAVVVRDVTGRGSDEGGGLADRFSDEEMTDDQLDQVQEDPFDMNAELRDLVRVGQFEVSIRILMAALVVGYLVAGYFIGLFLSSVLFVAAFVLLLRMSVRNAVIVFAFVLGVLYLFQVGLNVDLWNGTLLSAGGFVR